MCGRTACTLAPDDICKACSYKDGKLGKRVRPQWKDAPGGQQYYTSYNMAPSRHTPVILSSKHLESNEEVSTERVIQPMQWGLVPSWHKGSTKSVGYSMNNCRSESMLDKRSFKVPLVKGRRCVVLADGFYEWKTDKSGSKHPYFIYFPQSTYTDSVSLNVQKEELQKMDSPGEEEDPDTVWQGKRLLMMAGVFDVHKGEESASPLYSYSIITVESSGPVAEIHHRMPAILDGDDEVNQWLDFGAVSLEKAISLVRPTTNLQMHPVSNVVNNSRNNTPDCIKPAEEVKPKQSASSSFMKAWLQKGKKREQETGDVEETKQKKSKQRPSS